MSTLENPIDFDERRWLERYVREDGKTLEWDELQSVLHFLFFWALFEAECCDEKATFRRIQNFTRRVSRRPFGRITCQLKEPLAYFRQRYVKQGQLNALFHALEIPAENYEGEPIPNKKIASEVLLGQDETQTLLGLLLIVKQLRNKLFHGAKNPGNLHAYRENFYWANQILAECLEANRQR